jgi:hypothetical protein
MKKIINFLSWNFVKKSFGTVSLFLRKITFSKFALIAFVAILSVFSACSYYRVTTTPYADQNTISPLTNLNKVFVIHYGSNVYIINKIKLENDSIKGSFLADYYQFPVNKNTFPIENSSNKYKPKKGDRRIVNEVHLYVQLGALTTPNSTSIALKDITRCDIYKHDAAKTTIVGILTVFGILVSPYVIIALILLILAVTGSSCPYVYVNNGHGFVFAGEIYSGAIYAPLERNDYLTLPQLVSVNGKYQLKIANELQEVQHTNLMELIVIDHPVKSEVLIDKYGKCQTGAEIVSPLTASNFIGTDILDLVKTKDSLCYIGFTPDKDAPLTDGAIMTFDLPKGAKTAKIFVRARNSIWLDNVYKNFHGMLGSYNDKWTEKQNNSDPKKLMDWTISQKIPLLVYVEKNGQWVYFDNFNMVGPMALKDDVLSIDLTGIDKDKLKIKLEAGAYFWEVDFVGVDFSANIPVKMSTISLDNAITEDKIEVVGLLNSDDSNYYVQPETDNVAELTFTVPEKTNLDRTVILHSKGFYQINQESKGLPQMKKLKKIRKPGKFPEYSRKLMLDGIESLQN